MEVMNHDNLYTHVGEEYPQVPKAHIKDWDQFSHFPKAHLHLIPAGQEAGS